MPDRPTVDLEVIVPVLNEERRIGCTIEAVAGYLGRQPYVAALVVVDNGSVDRTAEVVVEAGADSPVPIHLINCANRGKGAAVRRGVLSSHSTFLGFCDADLAAPIEMLDFVWPLLQGGAPIVIGSRRCRGASWHRNRTLTRRIGSYGFNLISCSLIRGVSDTQCGFKFFEGEVARRLFATTRTAGFSFDVEILAQARADGLSILEVPVVWTDLAGSTLRPIRDGVPSLIEAVAVA
ncbi:MAG: glycosyltransferase, partial [Acidimicrobiales bacterium]